MSEHAEGFVIIEAPAADVIEVIEDYESYPDWAEVETREGAAARRGRPSDRGRVRGRRPRARQGRVHAAYRYAPGDGALSWVTKEARGAIRDIRGEYLLNELDDSDDEGDLRLAVDLGVLVPGFAAHEGAKRVIENALES